jgi:hypothetical protein
MPPPLPKPSELGLMAKAANPVNTGSLTRQLQNSYDVSVI